MSPWSWRRLHATLALVCMLAVVAARVHAQAPPAAPGDSPDPLRQADHAWQALAQDAEANGTVLQKVLLAWRAPVAHYAEGSRELASLTNDALGAQDAIVALVMATGCDAPDVGCDARVFANEATKLEPDNAVAWLLQWSAAIGQGDVQAADRALLHAESAPKWVDHALDMTRALNALAPPSAPTLVQLDARMRSRPRVIGVLDEVYRQVAVLCDLPANHTACLLIIDKLSASPGTLLQATMSAALSRHYGVPQDVAAARRDAIEAAQYVLGKREPPAINASDPELGAQRALRYMDELAAAGEMASAQVLLKKLALTNAQAAERFRQEHPVAGPAAGRATGASP